MLEQITCECAVVRQTLLTGSQDTNKYQSTKRNDLTAPEIKEIRGCPIEEQVNRGIYLLA